MVFTNGIFVSRVGFVPQRFIYGSLNQYHIYSGTWSVKNYQSTSACSVTSSNTSAALLWLPGDLNKNSSSMISLSREVGFQPAVRIWTLDVQKTPSCNKNLWTHSCPYWPVYSLASKRVCTLFSIASPRMTYNPSEHLLFEGRNLSQFYGARKSIFIARM